MSDTTASIIQNDGFTEVSIGNSRILSEAQKISESGGVSFYSKLGFAINNNINLIDQGAEALSKYVGDLVDISVLNHQYFDEKYGKFRNFIKRDVYLDKTKEKEMQQSRKSCDLFSMLLVEGTIKGGARALAKHMIAKDNHDFYQKMMDILCYYARTDEKDSSMIKTNMELNKICNSFNLGNTQKVRIKKIEDIVNIDMDVVRDNEKAKECLSFFLFDLFIQKYGNKEIDELSNYNKDLLSMYELLGYTQNEAKDVYKSNLDDYDRISIEEIKYLSLARGLEKTIYIDLPCFDIKALSEKSKKMSEFDPYAIRRKKVKKSTSTMAGASMAAILQKDPETMLKGAVLALAQFAHDDDTINETYKKMLGIGMSGTDISTIIDKAQILSDTSNIINNVGNNLGNDIRS